MSRKELKTMGKKLIICLIVLFMLGSYFPALSTIVRAATTEENNVTETNKSDANKENNTILEDINVKDKSTSANEANTTSANKNTVQTNTTTSNSTNVIGADKTATDINVVNANTITEKENTKVPAETPVKAPTKAPAKTAVEEIDKVVEIKDATLKQNLLRDYDSNGDGKLTESEMLQITSLYLSYRDKTIDLSGLEYAKNLEGLTIREGQYENLNVLYNLEKINRLDLESDKVKNLKNFKTVNTLESLYLSNHTQDASLIDYKYLEGLTSLKELSILDYALQTEFDIKSLSKLIKLETLRLNFNNAIKDITPLKNFKNLKSLEISSTDTSENIETLKGLDIRDLRYSQKIEDTIYIEKGKKKEVELLTVLQKMTDTTSPLYVDNITINSDLISLNGQKTKLVLDGTNTNIGAQGYAHINGYYNYSNETGTRNINRNISISINYKVRAEVEKLEEINIPDGELKRFLLKEHDIDGDKKITNYDMLQLSGFAPSGSYEIKNLTGLEAAENLTYVSLGNRYEDISALNKLKNLTGLNISGNFNEITSKLTIMNNITSLDINDYGKNGTDFDYAYIGTLTNLKYLTINENSRKTNIDINNLKNLTNLERLYISSKVELNNLEALQNLKVLQNLGLHTGDKLKNISFVSKLTELTNLDLSNNMISNIKPLRGLKKLQYLNITDNPINTKESETAETIKILQDNGVSISIRETNKKPNIEFKDPNFKKAILSEVDINKDNQIAIDEMEGRYSISISGSSNEEISSIEEITYANNLECLYIYGKVTDITPITKLKKLKTLSISSDSLNDKNLKVIATLTNLEYLSISTNKDINNLEALGNLKKLKTLEISNYVYVDNKQKVFDLKGIEKLTNLERLGISGSVTSINLLKKLTKLNYLRISEKLYNDKGEQLTEKEVVEYLKALNIKDTRFSGNSSKEVNLGIIPVGIDKKLDLSTIDSELVKLAFTKGSIVYDEYPRISYYVNNENKVGHPIPLDTSAMGEKYMSVNINSDKFNYSLSLRWRNYIKGDTSKEINIPDANLKKILLEEHDIDGDKRITEQDMINIEWLYAGESEISTIEGLQYAKNLKDLSLYKNYITDISPIIGISTLESVYLGKNLITDVSMLKNAKWSNLYDIDFSNNFIDFKKNNANYNALRDLMKVMTNTYKNWEDKFNRIVNSQYTNIKEIENEVNLEENLRARLIRLGLDKNSDGKITRKEMYYADIPAGDDYILNLSKAGITDISGLEYLGCGFINLSKNNIKDITPLTKNKSIYVLDLSDNNITNISGIENLYDLRSINLSNNKITDLTPFSKIPDVADIVIGEYGYDGYIVDLSNNEITDITPLSNLFKTNSMRRWRDTDINLANNKISNIDSVKSWKYIGSLDLSGNQITDIKGLNDYNFKVYDNMSEEEIIDAAQYLTIDLSANNINMTKAENKKAKELFDKMGATLKLVDKTKATEYILNENGIYTSDSNLGVVNTELSVEGQYEFVLVREKNDYYPVGSDAKLAGIFVNTKYYDGNKAHEEELKANGYAVEILVTGAMKTEKELDGTEYIKVWLKLPDGYVGNNAQMKTEGSQILDSSRNTLELNLKLTPSENDNKYGSFIASICLKPKECTMEISENNEDIINALMNEQNVTIDMKKEVQEVGSDIFKVLANQDDVELKIETSNAVWKFNSNDIVDSNMSLNPKVTMANKKFENMDGKPPFEDAIYLKFDHEGKLPGRAEIELDISGHNIYEKGKTVYLYYYNPETGEYEYIDVVQVGDNKIVITLDHCSEYVISDKLLKNEEDDSNGNKTPGEINDDGSEDSNDPNNGNKDKNPNKPKTGDDSNIALWITLMITAIVGIVFITLQGKIKERKIKHRK